MNYLILISIIATLILILRLLRGQIRKGLYMLRSKLQIGSLRQAINDADENKEQTGRKTMVVFNRQSGNYEALEKKLLKKASASGKNKNNAKQTDGRKRFQKKKTRVFDNERVKTIERKSLYITK